MMSEKIINLTSFLYRYIDYINYYMEYEKDVDDKKCFIEWWQEKGLTRMYKNYKNIDFLNIKENKVDIFIEYYESAIQDAIEENDLNVLVDWLYAIPYRMYKELIIEGVQPTFPTNTTLRNLVP